MTPDHPALDRRVAELEAAVLETLRILKATLGFLIPKIPKDIEQETAKADLDRLRAIADRLRGGAAVPEHDCRDHQQPPDGDCAICGRHPSPLDYDGPAPFPPPTSAPSEETRQQLADGMQKAWRASPAPTHWGAAADFAWNFVAGQFASRLAPAVPEADALAEAVAGVINDCAGLPAGSPNFSVRNKTIQQLDAALAAYRAAPRAPQEGRNHDRSIAT